jgi:hypothetical protein
MICHYSETNHLVLKSLSHLNSQNVPIFSSGFHLKKKKQFLYIPNLNILQITFSSKYSYISFKCEIALFTL